MIASLPGPAPKDMVWVPGGSFRMGSDDWYPEERPVHIVNVEGFWMDQHPVTVAAFRRFVKAPGARWNEPLAPALLALEGRSIAWSPLH